jgi:hypothetical protein
MQRARPTSVFRMRINHTTHRIETKSLFWMRHWRMIGRTLQAGGVRVSVQRPLDYRRGSRALPLPTKSCGVLRKLLRIKGEVPFFERAADTPQLRDSRRFIVICCRALSSERKPPNRPGLRHRPDRAVDAHDRKGPFCNVSRVVFSRLRSGQVPLAVMTRRSPASGCCLLTTV